MKEFKGRVVIPGECSATALVSHGGFNTLASYQTSFLTGDKKATCSDQNNPDIYKKYTGEEGSVMTENLQYLLQRAGSERVIVRVPLIPEYNTEEDQKKSAQMLTEMGVEKLDLFSYCIRD